MLRFSLPALTLAVLAVASAQADVYKFVDEKGRVQYTDKPQTLPAERLNVRSQKTDPAVVQARAEDERQRMEASSRTREAGARQAADQREAAELTAKDRAERCTKARERYDNYMMSQRLYEALPDGERRYLSDAELDAARANAKTAMDELCKGP
jgi:hypothetical protein